MLLSSPRRLAALLLAGGAAPSAALLAAAPGALGSGQPTQLATALLLAVAHFSKLTAVKACDNIVYCKFGRAQTDNTFSTDTGQSCVAACNGNCCTGENANIPPNGWPGRGPVPNFYTPCDEGRFAVCADEGDGSCAGVHACTNNYSQLISGGSCVGKNACHNQAPGPDPRFERPRLGATTYVGPITDGSCHGDRACATVGGIVESISGRSCRGDHVCEYLAAYGGHIDHVDGGSCNGTRACMHLNNNGGGIGNITGSCNGDYACTHLSYTNPAPMGPLLGCCNGDQECSCVGNNNNWAANPTCSADDADAPLPSECAYLSSPTQAPTAAGPWTLDYGGLEANFTSSASNELEVGFFMGVGREVEVAVLETCDVDADPVPSGVYSKMVSPVPAESNTTHTKIIVGYNFDKAQMIGSSLWNATSEKLTFCQVTSLTTPDPNGGPDWVITSDRRVIEIQFDLDANFEVDVDLADRTIFNETKTISYDNDVEAYKCRGGDDNSFLPEGGALAPNVELAICIRIKNNTSVNIDQLALMTIAQDGKTDFIVARSGNPVLTDLTQMPPVSQGVIVKTRVPMGGSGFEFENGLSLNISGTVDLELATSRKLRALVGENDVAEEGREEAGYDVTVNVQSTADGFGPIGSSDGHVIVGKGLATLSLIVAATVGLVM